MARFCSLCVRLVLSVMMVVTLAPAVASASDLTVLCQVLNPVTHQAQEVFRPGEDVFLALQLNVPSDAVGKLVKVVMKGQARVAGARISLRLNPLHVSFPNEDPGFGNLGQILPFAGPLTLNTRVTIPRGTPGANAQLIATVEVEEVGQGTCEGAIKIRR